MTHTGSPRGSKDLVVGSSQHADSYEEDMHRECRKIYQPFCDEERDTLKGHHFRTVSCRKWCDRALANADFQHAACCVPVPGQSRKRVPLDTIARSLGGAPSWSAAGQGS